jgi:hypothetical protein
MVGAAPPRSIIFVANTEANVYCVLVHPDRQEACSFHIGSIVLCSLELRGKGTAVTYISGVV